MRLTGFAVLALASVAVAQAGQVITVNYTLGSQVFAPAGAYSNGDSLAAGSSAGTGGFQLSSGGATSTQTVINLLIGTGSTNMAASGKTDTITMTLLTTGLNGLTITSTNPQSLSWTVTDTTTGGSTHTFAYTPGAAVSFTLSDNTRLIVTPQAHTNTVLGNNLTNQSVQLQASFAYQAPEPGTYVLLGAGLSVLALLRRRKA